MASALSWYEIPVTDFERAASFYSALLEKEIVQQQMNPDLVYGIIPNDGEGVGGTLAMGGHYVPSDTGVVVYLYVVGISAALGRIAGKCGTILGPQVSLGEAYGNAQVIHLRDSEGNRIGLFSQVLF